MARSSNEFPETLSDRSLENLLVKHGVAMIVRVEKKQNQTHFFQKILGGVWQNLMNDKVCVRVQGVWNPRGCDGIA